MSNTWPQNPQSGGWVDCSSFWRHTEPTGKGYGDGANFGMGMRGSGHAYAGLRNHSCQYDEWEEVFFETYQSDLDALPFEVIIANIHLAAHTTLFAPPNQGETE
jgi:hypothetical protein